MPRYRKLSIEVDAIVWTGDNESDVREFVLDHAGVTNYARWIVHEGMMGDPLYGEVYVDRSKALCRVERGGAIIAEPDGNGVYPCTPDDFTTGFEPISD